MTGFGARESVLEMRRVPWSAPMALALLGLWLWFSGTGVAAPTPPSAGEDPGRGASPGDEAPTAAPGPSPTDAAAPAGDVVVARVGDERITVADVQGEMAAMSPPTRSRFQDPDQRADLAVGLARFALLARGAEGRGFGDDPEVVRAFEEAMVQQLLRRDFDDRFPPDAIPVDEARRYFEAHRDEFGRPELRRASHIVVATREEATELLEQAKELDPRGFRALAQGVSLDDASKLRGGDLRFFTRDGTFPGRPGQAVPPPVAEAAFAIDAVDGLHPEPVPVGDRFSVVLLTGLRLAETRTFDQVGGTIRVRLARKRRNDAIDALRRSLRQQTPPTIDRDVLESFELDLPEPPAPGRPPVSAPLSPMAPRRSASDEDVDRARPTASGEEAAAAAAGDDDGSDRRPRPD